MKKWIVRLSTPLSINHDSEFPMATVANEKVSSDPYFQELFAERIGGISYGKGNEIYKFEKIKRAKRKALADYPNRLFLILGSAKTILWPM